MENNKSRRVHCLVLSYPAQGHISPMLQFSKLLEHEGVRISLASTRFFCNNLHQVPPTIALETISDGFDQTGSEGAENFRAYLDRLWEVGPETLIGLIEKLGGLGDPFDCIIYDAFFPWALEVAKSFGIVGVAFFTQNMAVNSVYYHFHLGNLRVPLMEQEFSFPALPKLELGDMPSFFFTYEESPGLLELLVGQFANVDKADWVFCNTFHELGKEINDWTTEIWPKFRTVGPNIPSMFLDKQHKDDKEYGVAQFKSSDQECMEWLDNKPKGSVVYVSTGSMVTLAEDQIKELAYGLRDSGSYFLWAIRASEHGKLPKDFEMKSEKGLVVTWCPQLKVLAQEAVGCFVTHCGWNSTLEALCLGVPMVAMPQWSDQFTNAKLIVDVWKMGIRAPIDEKKIVTREALKECIRKIMESEGGKEVKSNVIKWKSLAVGAVSKGGSSHENIKKFVNYLSHLHDACP